MLPRWSFRYGAYEEEEDWDLSALSAINSQLKMYIGRLPGGPGDLTLAELQEMATRQQQQMESQQQVLVAKEQRLKYLKQQEARHAQLASESERLRKIRERVESQELKLKKLRALRGQAEQYRSNNGQLNSELDAVKAVFNEKEKELAMAVARVDQLTRQLNDLQTGKTNTGLSGQKHAAAAQELEKLRKELLLRNKLNEQQTNSIAAKERILHQKQEEVKNMDNRIQELQQRLRKRKMQENQNKQLAYKQAATNSQNVKLDNKENAYTQNNTANNNAIRSGDPYIQYAPNDVVKDDSYSQSGNFIKQDPKYQTLPPGVRFSQPPNSEYKSVRPPHSNTNDNRDSPGEYNLPVVLPIGNNNNQTKAGYNHNTSHTPHQQHQPHQQQQHHHHQDLINQPHNKQQPQNFNNNDFSKPNQNFTNISAPQQIHHSTSQHHQQPPPHPAASHRQTQKPATVVDQSNNKSYPPTSTNRFIPAPNTPRSSSSSTTTTTAAQGTKVVESVGKGGVGGGGSSSLHPVISIHEEERQAGSGQSSPASSEGSSNSSGGIQTKPDETTVNETPIGSVSAMIERLNKGNNNSNQSKESAKTPESSLSSHPISQTNGHSKAALEGVTTFLAPGKQQYSRHPASSQGVPLDSTVSSAPQYVNQISNNNNNTSPTLPPTSQPQGSHPQLNLKPAPTYRYASKNQIANTYMGRLGGAAMEKYQQNLNKLYKNLESQDSKTGSVGVPYPTQTPSAGGPGAEVEGQTAFGSVSPHDYPDIASDKGSYKLNTPKQVRRRHSDGESDEVNKALQDRQELEAKEQQQSEEAAKSLKDKEKPVGTKPAEAENDKKQKLVNSVSKLPEPSPETSSSSSSSSASAKTTTTTAQSTTPAATLSTTTSSSIPADSKLSSESQDTPDGKQSKVKAIAKKTKSNLKKSDKRRSNNRVSFDPLALLLDGSLEGELDLVKKVAVQVDDVSTPNDEGITALHNAICAGHYEIVKFLIEFGCDVNSPDSDGWTPLHCAASCNNLPMVRFLVEHGACVFATTISDQETAADKCEEDEDGYDGCSDYLYSIQEKLGITNAGEVYAVFDYSASNADELSFVINDKITVLRKGDDKEKEWWWAQLNGKDGYIPRNLLGLYPRVLQLPSEVSEC